MNIPFTDLNAQYLELRPIIQDRINRVLDHGQYIMGPEVKELERALEAYVGAKNCITVSSGTEALLISLMALGIKPGDEVITTPFTFIATAEAIVLLGAVPIYVDIEEETCNINANELQTKITSKTKAIIPVSLYGQPSDMDEINEIAFNNGNIVVIEDAAQSFGAKYKEKRSCNLSTIGCTSFFPSKPLGCYGDGGAIFTNSDFLAEAMREIRIHGQSQRYLHTRVGVGGRMDTLQCAIVLAKLENFEKEIEIREKVANNYIKLFKKYGDDSNQIKIIKVKDSRSSAYGQFTIVSNNRDELQEKLKKVGVPTTVHYPIPLNEQPAYKNISPISYTPISKAMANKVMSIPMGPYLTYEHQEKIVQAIYSKSE